LNGSSFGRLFRITTFGESHRGVVGVVIDGFPGGFDISLSEVQRELDRRRPGRDRTVSQREEPDILEVVSGIVDGRTVGGPIRLQVSNRNARSSDYDEIVRKPRPGHADLTYYLKYGSIRPGGGRASARETVGRVLAGAVAKQALAREGIKIHGRILEVHGNRTEHEKTILEAKAKKDSVGGVVEIIAEGVPPGLGEPVFDRLDADLAKALMSIGSVKGVEIGAGFGSTLMMGSENNDPIVIEDGLLRTRTNNAGGILGGISNGMPVVCRIAVKPTSSIGLEQDTVDLDAMMPAKIAVKGRHDPCICPRMVPVAEAMVAITLLDHLFRARMSGNGTPRSEEKNVLGAEKGSLEGLRKKVTQNDKKMVLLLKKRMELTKEIGKRKKALGIPVKDPAVEQAVIENALRSGREQGLSPRLVERIMRTVIAESNLWQEAIYGTGKRRPGRRKSI
jgi:chorismate synthase